jgi:glucokinase
MPDPSAVPASGRRYIIGVDLGGTKISVGAMPDDGSRELGVRSLPTRAEQGAHAVIDRIVEMIEAVITAVMADEGVSRSAFAGVGVGAPGPLDEGRGVVVVAPNLGWRNLPLRAMLAERVGLPVVLDNDANCATLGEAWIGAARGARYVLGLTLGTGIGGGLIVNGRLYHGASNVAGEVGHMTIETQGRRCACGNYGCLEAYASGPNIAQRAREALEAGETSILLDMVDGDLSLITAQHVYDANDRGDAVAHEVVRETARFLGAGVANLLNVFNPDVVVLAGGVTRAGPALFDPLRAEVRRRAFKPAVDAARIVPGTLQGTAGVVGAVKVFLDHHAA